MSVGHRLQVWRAASPAITGSGLVRESDPAAWVAAVGGMLGEMRTRLGHDSELVLGMAAQRSSFVVWNAQSGKAVTPLISWQDRRAADWTANHADWGDAFWECTGLKLSAHYTGPKLAVLLNAEPEIANGLADGSLLVGNLDSWLIWNLGDGVHQTDMGMAARSGMVDIDAGTWSNTLLQKFGVPSGALPAIESTVRQAGVPLRHGFVLKASLADQAAAYLAVAGTRRDATIVNLGTGGFVLTESPCAERRQGYLTAPVMTDEDGRRRCVLEGTINGAGPAVNRFGRDDVELHRDDDAPDAFALPDMTGVGAPHWRPHLGMTLSEPAMVLTGPARRRIVLEGVLFRVAEILEGMDVVGGDLFLTGGLANDPSVSRGLAALTGRPVLVPDQAEGGLLAAAKLAAGQTCSEPGTVREVFPGPAGSYLKAKYPRWKAWLTALLQTTG
jgi:glycerol kinase